MKAEFPIFISNGAMITLDYYLTDDEVEIIKVAEKEEKPLWQVQELEILIDRIFDDAFDEMANGVYDDDDFINMHLDGEYDFDKAREYIVQNYFINIGYPKLENK